MNGCQFSVFTAPAAAKTNTRMAAILITTITLFALALSFTPRTRIQVSTMNHEQRRDVEVAARQLPARNHRLGQAASAR